MQSLVVRCGDSRVATKCITMTCQVLEIQNSEGLNSCFFMKCVGATPCCVMHTVAHTRLASRYLLWHATQPAGFSPGCIATFVAVAIGTASSRSVTRKRSSGALGGRETQTSSLESPDVADSVASSVSGMDHGIHYKRPLLHGAERKTLCSRLGVETPS